MWRGLSLAPLDLQPGLATVLQATQGSDTTRYLHAPRGIHAQQDASDNWTWMLQDGLGSVRSVVDNSLNPLESRLYEPYGTPFGTSGSVQTSYGFTGEQTDGNGQVYLRARYYNPSIGVFTGLDPFEGIMDQAMSLNGYSWVEGNVINAIDPSGMWGESPYVWDVCGGDTDRREQPNDKNRRAKRQNDSLGELIQSLIDQYPIDSITEGQGFPVLDNRNLPTLNNLSEALSLIERRLSRSLRSIMSNRVNISLDYTVGGGFEGYVNLYQTTSFPVQLGNAIFAETIVHEWGHVLDRDKQLHHSDYLQAPGHIVGTGSQQPTCNNNRGTNVHGSKVFVISGVPDDQLGNYQRCLVGYGTYTANPDINVREDWADMFMGWIYNGQSSSHGAGFDKDSNLQARISRLVWMREYIPSL